MSEFGQNGSYHLMFRWLCAHSRLDNHFDLSIHEIRREPSPISAPVPSLSADNEDAGLYFPNVAEPRAHEAQGSLSVECFFHRNYEDQSGFRWTGPHPLSISTLPDDLFLYVSAYFPSDEVYWVEFRLARVDQSTDETAGEHLFFLPRIETTWGTCTGCASRCWTWSPKLFWSHIPMFPIVFVAANGASVVFRSLDPFPASNTTHDAISRSIILCNLPVSYR